MAATPKIAIIGSGLGGLSASIHLALAGAKVTVYEQNPNPGGKAGEFQENGFRFDTGPSLLTMPFVLKEIFESAGKNINDYLTLNKLSNLCKYFYPDGSILNAYSDINEFANEIDRTSGDTVGQVRRYFRYCRRIYETAAGLFLFRDFRDPANFFSLPALRTLFLIHRIDPFRTMHGANTSFFSDPRIVQLFDRYATYNGSNPYEAPATLNIIQHVEYALGGYTVTGGIYEVPKSLTKLAKGSGVTFSFNTKIDRIIYRNKSVTAIKTGDRTESYHAIISNVDAGFTYKHLLQNESGKDARRYFKQDPSSSALVFYWGVKGTFNRLEMHNIFFSKNYKTEFDSIFNKHSCPGDPTVYVYISSRINTSDAPPGYENWFVMINTPPDTGQNWDAEIQRMRKIILEKLSSILRTNIGSKIVYERVLSPVSIQQHTGSLGGSLYGISSNSRYSAFLRQPISSRDYRGLYFCGGSTHPGGGIPLVLLSGKLAAAKIMNDYKIGK